MRTLIINNAHVDYYLLISSCKPSSGAVRSAWDGKSAGAGSDFGVAIYEKRFAG
jgi:hypothetical protein